MFDSQEAPSIKSPALYAGLYFITENAKKMTPLVVSSKSFLHNGAIPSRFTCDGSNISPAFYWQLPKDNVSLSLVVDNPDALDLNVPMMVWIRWFLYNVSTFACGHEAGVSTENLGCNL